jgi:4'-phosphopantetheinyl transferase
MVVAAPGPCGSWLPVQPWRPGDPFTSPPATDPTAPPLLLLIDRRDPLLPQAVERWRHCLSAAEQAAVQARRRPDDRARALLVRLGLRLALAHWLQHDPAAVELRPGPHGKPERLTVDGSVAPVPGFNGAHSGDLVLLGLHPCQPMGVDLEADRLPRHWPAIARRCLPPDRCDRLLALAPDQGGRAFLEEWCRHEAGLKAVGWGLAAAPPSDHWPPMRHWRLSLPQNHVGAAAVVSAPGGPPAAASPLP